jgi:hypothetical protein
LKLEINDKENNQERNSLVNDKGYLCDCISQCLLIDIIVYPILLQDHLVRRHENSKGQKQQKVKKLKLEINGKENSQATKPLVTKKVLCNNM